jgi:phosphoesterase RecJ-like protein
LGAETALYHYLKCSGKEVRVHNPDPLPGRYQFLDPKSQFLQNPDPREAWEDFDLWVIVDTNDPRRLGRTWDALKNRAKRIVFWDHHPDLISSKENVPYPPHAMLVSDDQSSSIGELLYELFNDLSMTEINADMALGLYVSVMTDTNSFRYARTTSTCHQIAAHMIELGVSPDEVYQQIYSTKELSHIQLLGTLLQNTKVSKSGKLAWMEMKLDLRRKFNATADDTMSFLNLLLVLRNAEVVCIFREEDDGISTRVSIKSKGKIVVNEVAMALGGGGHKYEAGVALKNGFEQAVREITSRLDDRIAQG